MNNKMKAFLLLIIFLHFAACKRVKQCGRFIPGCVKILSDGTCPITALCYPGFQRKVCDSGCCCFLRNSFLPKGT